MSGRFELRKSPVDGLIRKWERIPASLCLDLITSEPILQPGESDYDLWVVTGVYQKRKDVFNELKRRTV